MNYTNITGRANTICQRTVCLKTIQNAARVSGTSVGGTTKPGQGRLYAICAALAEGLARYTGVVSSTCG